MCHNVKYLPVVPVKKKKIESHCSMRAPTNPDI